MKIRKKKIGIENYQSVGLLFVLPWIIGFLLFMFYPLLSSIFYSFSNVQMGNKATFVGLENYIRMFTNDIDFNASLKVTLNYVLISVVLKLSIALVFALILNMNLRFIGLYRTLLYLPSIFGGSVAIAMIWKMIFGYKGLVNTVLDVLSIKPVGWLVDPKLSLYTISFLNVWMFGASMIIFLAALKNIPIFLYEAATIDGASSLRKFISITIPQITPVILFNLIMQTINTFQDFTGAFVIPNEPGGPIKSTYLFTIKIYQHAFGNFELGYACALSMILFAIILFFTMLLTVTSKKWVFYADE